LAVRDATGKAASNTQILLNGRVEQKKSHMLDHHLINDSGANSDSGDQRQENTMAATETNTHHGLTEPEHTGRRIRLAAVLVSIVFWGLIAYYAFS
jgi:hypothetical protein